MRILHTADWHLGQTLHDVSRDVEHELFFSWLLDVLEERLTDALLVAGDVFDGANPPARAQQLFFAFLAQARRRLPRLQIVVIGGNHDSAARLDAPKPVFDAFGIRMVGGLPRRGGEIDVESVLVPLQRGSEVRAVVLAIPFLRNADLLAVGGDDPLVEGVRAVYEAVTERARRDYPGVPLIAMGHLYLRFGAISELSERKILGGNLHAVPADIFSNASYAALGHLHLPQKVGSPHVRYSGSPIPLSLAEKDYPHQIVEVKIPGKMDDQAQTERIRVPRFVDMLRVPDRGAASVEEVVAQLEGLEVDGHGKGLEPFLEVAVRLDEPEPALRRLVEEALVGKPVRLAKITTQYTGASATADKEIVELSELRVEDVFERLWKSRYDEPVSRDVREALAELVERAQHEGGDAG